MQTFLPYPSFALTAKVLDNKRLGKQRVETLQILNALTNPNYGWQNHPAVKMWRGHKFTLITYGLAICDEWIERGFKDTCRNKINEFWRDATAEDSTEHAIPRFIGNNNFHLSHQSNLIRKSPEHYREYFGNEVPDNLPYLWILSR